MYKKDNMRKKKTLITWNIKMSNERFFIYIFFSSLVLALFRARTIFKIYDENFLQK